MWFFLCYWITLEHTFPQDLTIGRAAHDPEQTIDPSVADNVGPHRNCASKRRFRKSADLLRRNVRKIPQFGVGHAALLGGVGILGMVCESDHGVPLRNNDNEFALSTPRGEAVHWQAEYIDPP
jgi:hypothetical protein